MHWQDWIRQVASNTDFFRPEEQQARLDLDSELRERNMSPSSQPDRAHGGFPRHYDMTTPTDFGAYQIRVDESGNLLDDTFHFGQNQSGFDGRI